MITPPAAYATELAKPFRCPIYQVRLQRPHIDIDTPIAHWKLDETSGTRYDSIGSNHLSINNGVTYYASGKLGGAAHFTHDPAQYTGTQRLSVAVGGGSALQRGDRNWGVAVWVRLDSYPTGALDALDTVRTICGQWSGGVQTSWHLQYDTTNQFSFTVNDGVGSATVTSVNTHDVPLPGEWHLIQAWHDAGQNTIQIQVDNNQPAGLTTSRYARLSTVPFNVGSDDPWAGGTLGWDGYIDEVLIWDDVPTAPQLMQLYNVGDGVELEDFTVSATYEFCTSNPVDGYDLGEALLEPLYLDESAEIEKCRMPLSELSFKLHDFDDTITQIMSETDLAGWGVKFFMGFYDIPWYASSSPGVANHVQRFDGIITEVTYADGAYTVTARNKLAAANDKLIFNGATTSLTTAVNSTDTTFPVVDTTAFEYPAFDPQSMRKLLECEGELFNYRSKTDTEFGDIIRPGVNGFFVPPATAPSASHAAGATVREMIKLQSLSTANADAAADDSLHPIEQLKSILDDTGKYGIGESGIEYNETILDAIKAALGPELQFRFIFAEGMNAKDFIEKEIYLACAMYPTVNNLGELGAKLLQGADDATAVDTVTDDDIIAQPTWVRNAERIINSVVVKMDYLPTTKTYPTTFAYHDDSLILALGREIPMEIESKGIRREFSFGGLTWFETTADFLLEMSGRHIARFGLPAPVIAVQALMDKQLLEVGDDVECSFGQAINLGNGTRVLEDAAFEVMKIRHDFEQNTIEMSLLAYPS